MPDSNRTRRAARIRTRLRNMGLRDAFLFGIPALALVIGAFWFTALFIRPAPPNHLTISAGASGGAYQMFATRYAEIMERNHVELRIRASAGAMENLERLRDPHEEVDVGFVQSGLGSGGEDSGLVSLGSFYLEPLWIFYRGEKDLDSITQLHGNRIAIGAEGSGTRQLALDILEANGMRDSGARLSSAGGVEALQALQKGRIDAMFLVGTAQSPAIWAALYTPGVKLMSLAQAEAYTRRFPYLSKLTLPRGAIDLVREVPTHDVTLVAPTATLVAREDIHPALVDLLMQSAAEVHGRPDLFQRAGEFPNAGQADFPMSREADRFYKSGVTFLQRYMPFWAATLIDRMVVLLIPLVAVLFPLFKILPAVYNWRMRARIYKWYGELKFLEADIEEGSGQQDEWRQQLDRLEELVNHISTPLAYANELYMLREHIGMVRARLQSPA